MSSTELPQVTAGTRSRWLQRAGLAVFLVLLVVLARESARHSIDFPVYHRAARQILAGHFELYPQEAYDGHPGPSQGFRYLPAIAYLFVPFGLLPLEWSALVFYVLKLLALWWVGATIARRAGWPDWGFGAFALAFVIVGGYLAEELRFGNAHFFCVWLMVLAYDRVEAGKVLTPALALAVAIATKLTPLALLGYFVLRRRVSVVLATLAMLVVLVIAPAAATGWTAYERELRAYSTYALEKVDEGDNYSLRGALSRYLTPGHADISHVDASVADLSPAAINALWIAGVLVLGLAALFALWQASSDPVAKLLEFSIVLTGIVLASPHTQRRYFVTLFVPVVVLLTQWERLRSGQDRRLVLMGVLATAAPATILPLVFGGRRLALLYEATSPYFFGAFGLFAVLVILTLRCKSSFPVRSSAGRPARSSVDAGAHPVQQ